MLSQRLLPWFVFASVLAFALLIVILLPLSAIRRSRPFASVSIIIVSYVFGATVWMEGLLLTMALWGTFAVVAGLFFFWGRRSAGRYLAMLFKGMYTRLAELVVLTVLTFGTRFLAVWVCMKTGDSETTATQNLWSPDWRR